MQDLFSISKPKSGRSLVKAEVHKVTFQNVENGYTVLRARDTENEGLFTAVGYFGRMQPGEYYEFEGDWTDHAQYGKQLKVHQSRTVYPETETSILRYLRSGLIRGIGEKTAERIVSHFGSETLKILDEDPDRLAEIPRLGKKKSRELIAAWNERKSHRRVELFLANQGISPAFIHRIVRMYGEEAPRLVQEDPYRLARDINGIGFLTADQIALQLGFALDAQHRIAAAMAHLFALNEDQGHCFMTRIQVLDGLSQLLKLPRPDLEAKFEVCLEEALDRGQLVFDELRNTDGSVLDVYFAGRTFRAEETVALHLRALLQKPMPEITADRVERWITQYAEASGQAFSTEQMEAVLKAVQHRVFILTGGPGVGKTTTANAIIRLLIKLNRGVALAAPTGRAAQRLSEVAAIPAKTLHRLLEWSATEHCFLRDEDHPIEATALIIDEASMLDIHLASALMRALRPDAQIILIGDVDQLPSVGPGNVLRDLLESNVVPATRLTQIFRQATGSSIVRIAHQINRGETPSFSDQAYSDCQLIPIEDADLLKETIKQLMVKTLPEKSRFDPMRDVQVLTPMNRGPLGTQALNEMSQEVLNPDPKGLEKLEAGTHSFKPRDKVIQTVNNYDLSVFNGDIGFVEHAGFDGGKVLVNFGDRKVIYTKEDAYELKLAYAITIHKSQGSEFPVVIVPLSMQHFIMLQRNLIYTALTRARKIAILVGSQAALAQAIKTQTSLKRQTLLISRLQNLMAGL